jgi:type IV pilus assembly protein PilM
MRLPARLPALNLSFSLGRKSGGPEVVGLDIQPGFVAAVQARVNGSILAERAAVAPLAPDTMRDGEVADEDTLSEVLKELFADGALGKRVRVGVANQRTVLRTLELPPVTDQKELAAAVAFQAQDQVPMPLNNAVLDFHPLGIVDTPAGPRQRVVLVAAQRDMVERLLRAVQRAGLSPEGVDLSAFALIRSLYRPEGGEPARVLYLNVDGLTNLAIAEGKVCRFTRVVGGGLEGMAAEVAERRGIALAEARELVRQIDLSGPAPVREEIVVPEPGTVDLSSEAQAQADATEADATEADGDAPAAPDAETDKAEPSAATQAPATSDVWNVVESGIRDLSGEVRNSLDFHRSQDGGGDVAHVVLSGAAEAIPGFAEMLELSLGVSVRRQAVGVADGRLTEQFSTHRLAIATGLAAAEAPQ